MAKGFGGKYFSLQAITATVNAATLHSCFVRTKNCHTRNYYTTDSSIEESPLNGVDILLDTIEFFTSKVSRCQCHWNHFLGRRTKCAFDITSFIAKLRFLFRQFYIVISLPSNIKYSFYFFNILHWVHMAKIGHTYKNKYICRFLC